MNMDTSAVWRIVSTLMLQGMIFFLEIIGFMQGQKRHIFRPIYIYLLPWSIYGHNNGLKHDGVFSVSTKNAHNNMQHYISLKKNSYMFWHRSVTLQALEVLRSVSPKH